MSPISARSRKPTTVDVSMLSSSARASAGSSTGVCPEVTTLARPAHRACRVDRHDLAGDEPIKEMTDRSKPLLDARGRELACRSFDPCCDVHRLHAGDRRHPRARAPRQKFIGRAGVGAARVRVADVGGEEFEEAHASPLAGGGDECRQRGRADRDELVHVVPIRRATAIFANFFGPKPCVVIIGREALNSAASAFNRLCRM